MIDIHCHLLYGVDDGPAAIDESIAMLERAAEQGITDIILTPHYRRRMFRYDKEQIIENKNVLEPYAEELGINLYLGTEFHVNGDILDYLETGRCLSLAGGEYVLTEYEYDTEYSYLFKMTQELLRYGYIPVIAHVERYNCLVTKPQRLQELQEIGALIQVNAGAIAGHDGWSVKQYCKSILKKGWVDIVASDSHGINKRTCHMAKCYDYIARKYGDKLAHRLMDKNPRKIIGE